MLIFISIYFQGVVMICDGHDPVLAILRQQEKKVNAQQEAEIILNWIKELLDDDYKAILPKMLGVVSDNCSSWGSKSRFQSCSIIVHDFRSLFSCMIARFF